MCTTIAHCAFNAILLISTALILASIFTPGWYYFENRAGQSETAKENVVNRGLVLQTCFKDIEACSTDFWNKQNSIEKWTLCLLILCVGCCIFALSWSLLAFCACCCKECLTPPLPIAMAIAFFLDLAAILIYAMNSSHFDSLKTEIAKDIGSSLSEIKDHLGYSIWLAALGAFGLFANFVTGICLVCSAKHSPI